MLMAMKVTCIRMACVMCLLSACVSETDDEALTHGAELLAPLKAELKQALIAGLEQGPVNAIVVCSEQAPAIAAELSVDGVRIGRSSHRLRNPDNAAPDWVEPVLDSYLAEDSNRSPGLVALQGDRLGYVEPIEVQPLCLACHGKSLAPDVAAAVAEQYPDDAATGFDVGDLRGVYWVEFNVDR